MINIKRIVRFFVILLIITFNFTNSYGLDRNEILFISSYSPSFISFKDQIRGIEDVIGNEYNLQVQYMNAKSCDSMVDENNFYNLLKYSISSYKNLKGILIGDNVALEFYLKYKDDLFKDIPTSFFAVNNIDNIKSALTYDNVSGVREIESLDTTIDLIKNNHTNVENIIFIDNNNKVKNEFEKNNFNNNELNTSWIITENISCNDFIGKLKKIKKNSAIITLYPIYFNDIEWVDYEYINKLIKDNTYKTPIYACINYGVTEGIIGGKVINYYNQSKNATEILLKLINGEDSKGLYIGDDSINEYMFDYNTFKEYNIKKSDLPKNSIILNDPINIFYKYRILVVSTLFLFIGLICIIIALLNYIKYKVTYQDKLIRAKIAEEETNRLKSYFISNISHELKTPITVIMSVIQLIKVNNKECNDIKNIEIAHTNCQRLLRLINNIIDIEKFGSNQLKLDLENIKIIDLIEDIITSINPYAKSKNLTIIFDTNEEDIIMSLDFVKIERVILNLLSNAIKFSHENGEIHVNVIKNDTNVSISVKDFGVGISEVYLDQIFDRFTQVDNSMTRMNEGSGIGLSIVKAFVKMHNGSIDVKSKENEGSEFIITLPIDLKTDKDIFLYDSNVLDFDIKMEFSDIYI